MAAAHQARHISNFSRSMARASPVTSTEIEGRAYNRNIDLLRIPHDWQAHERSDICEPRYEL